MLVLKEIFFDSIIELIDPYEHNVTQNIQDLLSKSKFESLDETNDFLLEYNDFTNGSIELINSFVRIADMVDAFKIEVQLIFKALQLKFTS